MYPSSICTEYIKLKFLYTHTYTNTHSYSSCICRVLHLKSLNVKVIQNVLWIDLHVCASLRQSFNSRTFECPNDMLNWQTRGPTSAPPLPLPPYPPLGTCGPNCCIFKSLPSTEWRYGIQYLNKSGAEHCRTELFTQSPTLKWLVGNDWKEPDAYLSCQCSHWGVKSIKRVSFGAILYFNR